VREADVNAKERRELKKDLIDLKQNRGRTRFTLGLGGQAKGSIRAFREQLGISQAELARTFGVSLKRVQNWEQEATPQPAWARKLMGLVLADPENLARLQRL
jgi:DNA-binding transcriptional regulator YiaG